MARSRDGVEIVVRIEAAKGVAVVVRVKVPRAAWEGAKTHPAATALVRGAFFRHPAVSLLADDKPGEATVVVQAAVSGRVAARNYFRLTGARKGCSTPAEEDAAWRVLFFARKGVTWGPPVRHVAEGQAPRHDWEADVRNGGRDGGNGWK